MLYALIVGLLLGLIGCDPDDAFAQADPCERFVTCTNARPCTQPLNGPSVVCRQPTDADGCKTKAVTRCFPSTGGGVTTTTVRSSTSLFSTTRVPGSTVPTTSRPSTSTTTSLPPQETRFPAVRYGAKDVSRRFDDSQDINFDPITGAPANQYMRMVRALTQHTIYHPALLRAYRDFCPDLLDNAVGRYNVVYGKFTIHYSLKDMPQDYEFHANYIMDLWDGALDLFAECVRGRENELPEEIRILITDTPPPPVEQKKPPGFVAIAGAFDPKRKMQPLTREQCAAADLTHVLHENGSPALRAAHLALTQLARDPYEATLLDIMFVGPIDPTYENPPAGTPAQPGRVAYLTSRLNAAHTGWHAALKCGTGLPPDFVAAWIYNMEHARLHAMRNANVPGYAVRRAVDQDGLTPKCRLRPGIDRKFDPKAGIWVWGPEKYDNHACPVDAL